MTYFTSQWTPGSPKVIPTLVILDKIVQMEGDNITNPEKIEQFSLEIKCETGYNFSAFHRMCEIYSTIGKLQSPLSVNLKGLFRMIDLSIRTLYCSKGKFWNTELLYATRQSNNSELPLGNGVMHQKC